MIRRARRDADGVFGAAGWLFAELALVLMIIAVGSEQLDNPAQAEHPTTPVTTTTEPPSVPPPSPEGILLKSVKFTMPVPVNGDGVVERFRQELDKAVGANGRVGLILLFGVSRNPSEPMEGTGVSGRLKELITPAGLPQLRSTVDIRPYLGGNDDGQPGDVTVELFLLTGPS